MKNFQLIFMTLITLFSFYNVHAAKYDFEIDGIQYLITNTAYGKESVDIVGVNKETFSTGGCHKLSKIDLSPLKSCTHLPPICIF